MFATMRTLYRNITSDGSLAEGTLAKEITPPSKFPNVESMLLRPEPIWRNQDEASSSME
jgi:hypothetical protein